MVIYVKTIQEPYQFQYEIKKSKFISILLPFSNEEDLLPSLEKIKKEYPGATHYCYAFVLENKEKMSDNGEPSGTAGLPMLTLLKKNEITDVLLVVVRYFGGIKLGAGGLIRAYSHVAKEVLFHASYYTKSEGYLISFSCSYEEQKKYDAILKNILVQKEYQDQVVYQFTIEQNRLESLKLLLPNNFHIEPSIIYLPI